MVYIINFVLLILKYRENYLKSREIKMAWDKKLY